MREVKFRGYGIFGWWTGSLVKSEDGKYYIVKEVELSNDYGDGTDFYATNWSEVEPESVGQCTGLKDIEQFKDPRELYTGDIVKMHQFLFDGGEYENEIIGVLSYDEEVAAVCLTKIKHYDIQRYMGYGTNDIEFAEEKIPVCMFYGLHECSWTYVGNVYENPELVGEV